jgi:hypothetical protein
VAGRRSCPDGELAAFRAARAAANGRIEELHLLLRQVGMQSPDARRRIGRELEPRRARAQHRLHLRGDRIDFVRTRHRGEDELAPLHRIGSARGEMREALDGANVIGAHFMARRLQITGHRAPHDAEADERELHTPRSANTSLAMSAAVPAFGQPQ